MSTRGIKLLYKEARLDLEPESPSSIVEVQVSSRTRSPPLSLIATGNGGSFRGGYGSRHDGGSSGPIGDQERTFRAQNLAIASGIYRRRHHDSPRSFLWRVLEDGLVVSLRVADVCKPRGSSSHGVVVGGSQSKKDLPGSSTTEYLLILHLRFPHAVRPLCLGFSDPKDHDALCIFAVDTADQLYSIALRPDAFRRKLVTEGGVLDGGACKIWSPPAFGFRHPHRLVPISPDQLILTMHDGGILRFDKNRSHDGANAFSFSPNLPSLSAPG